MKTTAKKIARDENGNILILVLVLLVVGGLLLGPLLGLMSTGLVAGQVYEKKAAELYAADAGVEDAVWKIRREVDELPWPGRCSNYTTWVYPIPDVNRRSVNVTIIFVNDEMSGVTYRVVSRAVGEGSGTQIEAYVAGTPEYRNYASLMDHVITVNQDLDGNGLREFTKELGKIDIVYPSGCEGCASVYDYEAIPEGCEGCGAVYNYDDEYWPLWNELSAWYLRDVKNKMSYDVDTLVDLEGNSLPPGPVYINDVPFGSSDGLGPLYVDGELRITSSDSNVAANLTLDGTLYVTGDTMIYGPTAAKPYKLTIDLNGQTIFVASNSTHSKSALEIKNCNLIGPGVIIAGGDIAFTPNALSGVTGPIFIMSIQGTVTLQPSGAFYGAIAGDIYVDASQGNEPKIHYPADGFGDLNFPGLTPHVPLIYGIVSWNVGPA